MSDEREAADGKDEVFNEMSVTTFNQILPSLLDLLIAAERPRLMGLLRVRGRWPDVTNARTSAGNNPRYFGVVVTGEDGAEMQVDIQRRVVERSGAVAHQDVVLTGRLSIRGGRYGPEIRLAATDMEIGARELPILTDALDSSRVTLDGLKALDLSRRRFPDDRLVPITLLHSASSETQVHLDFVRSLENLRDAVRVTTCAVSMLDASAIAAAIRGAPAEGVLAVIRGGGERSVFEVFNDLQVVAALAEHKAHRVIGLGHSGDRTLLDLVADHTASTPAAAGIYVRDEIKRIRRHFAELKKAQEAAEAAAQLGAKANAAAAVWAFVGLAAGIGLTILFNFVVKG